MRGINSQPHAANATSNRPLVNETANKEKTSTRVIPPIPFNKDFFGVTADMKLRILQFNIYYRSTAYRISIVSYFDFDYFGGSVPRSPSIFARYTSAEGGSQVRAAPMFHQAKPATSDKATQRTPPATDHWETKPPTRPTATMSSRDHT